MEDLSFGLSLTYNKSDFKINKFTKTTSFVKLTKLNKMVDKPEIHISEGLDNRMVFE